MAIQRSQDCLSVIYASSRTLSIPIADVVTPGYKRVVPGEGMPSVHTHVTYTSYVWPGLIPHIFTYEELLIGFMHTATDSGTESTGKQVGIDTLTSI
eukprot:1149490-Pelagomonas_calceolata.AAC.7